MKLHDLGAGVLVAISLAYFGGWLVDQARPAPPPQCLVKARTADGRTLQRWRACTPAELDATAEGRA